MREREREAEREGRRERWKERVKTRSSILHVWTRDLRRSYYAIIEVERWSRGYTKGKTIEREREFHKSNHCIRCF